MPLRVSRQHELLLELESNGHLVFYTAPAFHRLSQLSDAYLARDVVHRSAFFRPSDIGALPDDAGHLVAFSFRSGQAFRLSSKPRDVKLYPGQPLFEQHIRALCRQPLPDLRPVSLRDLKHELLAIARDFLSDEANSTIEEALADKEPAWGLLLVCHTIFNVAPVFVPEAGM